MKRTTAVAIAVIFTLAVGLGLALGHQERDLRALRAEVAAEATRTATPASSASRVPDPLTADVEQMKQALSAQTTEDLKTEGRLLALEKVARAQQRPADPGLSAELVSLRSDLATQQRSIDDLKYKVDKLCAYLQRGEPAGLGGFYC